MKELLIITAWKYKEHDFFLQRQKCFSEREYERRFPKYTFDKKHQIMSSEYHYYSKAIHSSDEKKNNETILFTLDYATRLLQEEIDNLGLIDAFYEISFKEIISKFVLNDVDKIYIPLQTIIQINLEYEDDGDYYIKVDDVLFSNNKQIEDDTFDIWSL